MELDEQYRHDRDPRVNPVPGDILQKQEFFGSPGGGARKRSRIVVAVEPGLVCYRRTNRMGTRQVYFGRPMRKSWISLDDWRSWARNADVKNRTE
jgi:hypothetical protein